MRNAGNARNDSARSESLAERIGQIPGTIKHAFATFLGVPTIVVGIFLVLAVVTYVLDQRDASQLDPLAQFLQSHLFADAESTTQTLGNIAGGMITITSITFSLLLVALQQSAGSMTHAVFDQFLRRYLNQVYAGWFIGITLYTLITLATVRPEFNPIYGATLSLFFAVSALYVLLLLIYSAIEQMRPSAILESIHDHTLRARERQRSLLRRTRRQARLTGPPRCTVRSPEDGFVTAIDLDAIAKALDEAPRAEVALHLPLGAYAAFGDPLAEVRAAPADDIADLEQAIAGAIRLERERDLERDPSFGLEQMETIAWTTISTSKQDPNPGLEAVRNLRDLLARWAVADEETDGEDSSAERLPIVYPDDVLERLMGTIESLTVVASESMQHHVYADILRGLAITLDRLPPPLARRTEELVLRSLAGMGDHVLTAELDDALADVTDALEAADLIEGASAVRAARAGLATSVGRLNSRATRVPSE
ncbi:MAG: DUF2254 domain-containing protein [Chloroflexia bacterium]|nr:DUF2254 domain-containing protein [Chloroflexia bacterium]